MAICYRESIPIPVEIVQRLTPNHELAILAEKIDWQSIYERFKKFFHRKGRMAKQIRLHVGIQILKHRYAMSDEEVVQRLHRDVDFLNFCGFYLVKDPKQISVEVPKEIVSRLKDKQQYILIEPSSLTKFRRLVGAKGAQLLDCIIKEHLKKDGQLKTHTAVTDTTAMEKNIAYPTDTKLLYRGLEKLVKTIEKAKDCGVVGIEKIRSFKRKSKQVFLSAMKLGKDQLERIKKANSQLSQMLKSTVKQVPCVIEAISNFIDENKAKIEQNKIRLLERLSLKIKEVVLAVEQVIEQNRMRFEKGVHVANKRYSVHEPGVIAIKRGKAGKDYEYGAKVSITMTPNGYVVGHKVYHKKEVSDIETLPDVRESFEKATGRKLKNLGADRGLSHKDRYRLRTHDIKHLAIPRKGKKKHPDADKPWFRKLQRLRAGIEPVIGHLQSDHLMDKGRYKGTEGDQINAALAVIAWNLKKWAKQTQTKALGP